MSAEWGREVKGRANGIGAEINARIRKAESLRQLAIEERNGRNP